MKDLKIYLIVASILFGLYLLVEFNRPKVTDWQITLQNDDKKPFGTYILYNRINDIFPKAKLIAIREPVYNALTEHHIDKATYVVIANNVKLDKYDFAQLQKFVKNGNDVFIAATSFGDVFAKELKITTDFGTKNDDDIRIGFVSRYLNTNQYTADHNTTSYYFTDFDTVKAIVLGQNEFKNANYLKFKMGNGNLYLNSCPLMFSNYTLLQDQSASYAPVALSFVNNSKVLVWDQFYTMGREGEESAMRVFLQHPPLRWALYISFFSLVLFILYQKKRRQRIIPIVEPLKNSSLEFVNVVGQVYYEQRDNSNIAQKKITYFFEQLRAKYNVKTTLIDDEFRTTLASKSSVSADVIQQIISEMIMIRSGQPVSDSQLISLNKNIEQFYTQSR